VNFPCRAEIYAHYTKQTLANRCRIFTSQGVQNLVIPIEKPKEKCFIKDIKISNRSDWQMQHLRALKTAYNSAPFFDFYIDDLSKLYIKKENFLFDFNINLQISIINLLHYEKLDFSLSDNYEKNVNKNDLDLRNLFLSKKKIVNLPFNLEEKYEQVFSDKLGFQKNLSIFDLLFNLGNEARIYLKNSNKKNFN